MNYRYKKITEPFDAKIPILGKILHDSGLAKSVEAGIAKCRLELWRRERYILLYNEQDEPVALVSWRMDGDFDHGVYELTHIGTMVDHQGKGYGSILLKLLLNDVESWYETMGACKPRKQFVRTGKLSEEQKQEGRPDASGFYEKAGYVLEYISPKHFRNYRDEKVYAYYHSKGIYWELCAPFFVCQGVATTENSYC